MPQQDAEACDAQARSSDSYEQPRIALRGQVAARAGLRQPIRR